ncbi:hypothetical protein L1887_54664 [Cichorium endivia]|nr:hypothetical protein L1887_54664 [Cichorium endivia]
MGTPRTGGVHTCAKLQRGHGHTAAAALRFGIACGSDYFPRERTNKPLSPSPKGLYHPKPCPYYRTSSADKHKSPLVSAATFYPARPSETVLPIFEKYNQDLQPHPDLSSPTFLLPRTLAKLQRHRLETRFQSLQMPRRANVRGRPIGESDSSSEPRERLWMWCQDLSSGPSVAATMTFYFGVSTPGQRSKVETRTPPDSAVDPSSSFCASLWCLVLPSTMDIFGHRLTTYSQLGPIQNRKRKTNPFASVRGRRDIDASIDSTVEGQGMRESANQIVKGGEGATKARGR